MIQVVEAIFKDGHFWPLERVILKDRRRVWLAFEVIQEKENEVSYAARGNDLAPLLMTKLAEQGGAFDFLADPAEDVYSPKDGEEV